MTRVTTVAAALNEAEPQYDQTAKYADSVLLHLIRHVALYLFVLLSNTTKLAVTEALGALDAATSDVADEPIKNLQHRLHVALFAWVDREIDSNHFDGLLLEQRAFVVINRLLRQTRANTFATCRVLSGLLRWYITKLQMPLVQYEQNSMLSSTLEYLLTKEENAPINGSVSLQILYPLLNAVDLISIEQRECLDALVNLLRWLKLHDQSQEVLATFIYNYHAKLIGPLAFRESPGLDHDNRNLEFCNELGVCFVQMLLQHSDHIFRRDLQVVDIIPSLSYSDTEDDDASCENNNAPFSLALDDRNHLKGTKTTTSNISCPNASDCTERNQKMELAPMAWVHSELKYKQALIRWKNDFCVKYCSVAAAGLAGILFAVVSTRQLY
ncbi:hypothetical protein CCR75_004601 [Bremia lactucae]|uniref:Uncharacterized protein n=1 Tax=Bremia lactucae TaxID=4779 RepID=A0A976IED6_BRELC|nr:hypothetical protein CCR75_004601 [Bremia lactucae]